MERRSLSVIPLRRACPRNCRGYAFFHTLDPTGRGSAAGGKRLGTEGQALVELLVVLPVLLLLLLAASDIGKLFVISGKSEIAARYVALSHFREAPFGDAYPGQTAPQEIERLFFDDALDDSGSGEDDEADVTYTELGGDDFDYEPGVAWDSFLRGLWYDLLGGLDLAPIRGVRSSFAYDLPDFPYGREHPMEQTQALPEAPSPGGLAGVYEPSGNFVMLADSFSGDNGERIRLLLGVTNYIAGAELTSTIWAGYVAALWLFLFPS